MTLDLTTFTLVHVVISLVAIISGFVVLSGFLRGKQLNRWAAFFLATTAATSITGFLFPFERFLPSHAVGIVSLVVLPVALFARYGRRLAGRWRSIYVVSAMLLLYLNVFVLIVQAFQKVPALKELAPTQSEPPFSLTQLLVLVLFVLATVIAAIRFRKEIPEPDRSSANVARGAGEAIAMRASMLACAWIVVTALPAIAQVPNATEFNRAFTHHTTTVNKVRLHYVTGGKGEPVVLLHGFGSTWYMWRHVMPELAKHYTVIVPDLRGAGDSDKPATGYDKRTLAEDIYQLVRHLGHERIFLVGHDIGLMVSYAYASAHPADVRRLVLLDAPIPGTKVFEDFEQSPLLWHFRFHNVANLPESLVAGRERTYLTEGFYRALSYNPAAFTDADVDEYVRSYSAPGGMKAGFEYFRAFAEDARHNKEHFKTKLTMPVLALGGAQSLGPTMVDMVKEVASDVRGGSIERCGHWVADERPADLTERLIAFLGEGK